MKMLEKLKIAVQYAALGFVIVMKTIAKFTLGLALAVIGGGIGPYYLGRFLFVHLFKWDSPTDWVPGPGPILNWLLGIASLVAVPGLIKIGHDEHERREREVRIAASIAAIRERTEKEIAAIDAEDEVTKKHEEP